MATHPRQQDTSRQRLVGQLGKRDDAVLDASTASRSPGCEGHMSSGKTTMCSPEGHTAFGGRSGSLAAEGKLQQRESERLTGSKRGAHRVPAIFLKDTDMPAPAAKGNEGVCAPASAAQSLSFSLSGHKMSLSGPF